MKKKLLIGIGAAVLLLLIIIVAAVGVNLSHYKKTVEAIQINDVDLSRVSDGEYEGTCNLTLVIAQVKVIVKDGKITDINLIRHENGMGKPAEILPGKVVAVQSLKIDTVSGATASSKAILKAIENALESATKQ